jgi:lipoprotein-releasing system ATP-binding protein
MGMKRSATILRAENIWKEYPTGKTMALQVLKGADVTINEGELLVIVGPSGSGKSTLLHILGGLDRPTKGRVLFDEQVIFELDDEGLAAFRNKSMGFVFQFHHLLPEFSAVENVAMPALIQGGQLRDVRPRAEQLLDEVGLSDRLDHRPNELSGGEQQRVAVARALMNSPRLILADEPSGNLDEENGQKLHSLLVKLSQNRGLTFVIATHNPDLTKRANRILALSDGKLEPHRKL